MPFAVSLASPLFAVPAATLRHPSPERLNAALRSLFLARESEGEAHANATPLVARENVYESHFKLFDWPDGCVQELRAFCFGQLYRLVGELNGYDQAMLRRMQIGASAWFHVTRDGGSFGLHNHPMATWSGVYCVDAGGGPGQRARNGALCFPSPFASSLMFVDNSVVNLSRPYSAAPLEILFEPGQLVLFPSWLLHEVKPYRGDGERITVAFNTWFKTQPPLKTGVG